MRQTPIQHLSRIRRTQQLPHLLVPLSVNAEDQVLSLQLFLHHGECPLVFEVMNPGATHEEIVRFGPVNHQKPMVRGIDAKNRPVAKVTLDEEWSRISHEV